MLSEVDHLIRNLVPCFAEAAGLKQQADRIRRLPAILNVITIKHAVQALRALGKCTPGPARGASWSPLIQEISFWAEASIWTAAENNTEDCPVCVLFLKRNMDYAFSLLQEH